jgi:DNA-directed RNA polymerase specialized sigma24 family protein
MGDRKEARDKEFQSFVTGRWPRLLRTAFLLTGEQHAAEDLVQSTLEQVYVAWRRVGAADEPEAYVRRVMPANGTTNTDKPALHSTEGAPTDWFACLAPQGTESDSVTMTGDGNG